MILMRIFSQYRIQIQFILVFRDLVEAFFFPKSFDFLKILKLGESIPFNLSPLVDRIQQCVIYLDDHHTRGTDLKIPVPSHVTKIHIYEI